MLEIGSTRIKPGERKQININVARLYDFTEMNIPVEVIRGKEQGPRLFVSAATHGDEINGVEIIKRLLKHRALKKIKGTLIAVPIVNVFGYNTKSRYLPDRRDLNRHFPGSINGSLAEQLAHTFMSEIVLQCTHGIDLHTGAIHRSNLPQIRADLDDPQTNELAHNFNVPVMINSRLPDGSLREAAREAKIPILVFEGGEALRHDEHVIKSGLTGILTLMNEIGMIAYARGKKAQDEKLFMALSSTWVRAPQSGSLRQIRHIGNRVTKGQVLGVISDPFGGNKAEITASCTGIIVGAVTMPLLNKGDAAFHIASFDNSKQVKEQVDDFLDEI
ncbi:MAG: succinylglutamate desuccinylase/aspartoacylase family protein [Pseudomonadota bacterium]